MSYVDLTGVFEYKKLMPWSRLAQLANNDAFDVFRSGTRHLFYQASAPTGYTKITGNDNSAIRIVSGIGGGSGGAVNLSATVTLSHAHTINGHEHSEPAHTHLVDRTSSTNSDTSEYVFILTNQLFAKTGVLTGDFTPVFARDLTDSTGPTDSGSTSGGATDSQLSDVEFAYVDIIIASKDA
jgi:hypothetical protein